MQRWVKKAQNLYGHKGSPILPRRMNFRKSSKRPLTPSFSGNHVADFVTKVRMFITVGLLCIIWSYICWYAWSTTVQHCNWLKPCPEKTLLDHVHAEEVYLKVQILRYEFLDWKWLSPSSIRNFSENSSVLKGDPISFVLTNKDVPGTPKMEQPMDMKQLCKVECGAGENDRLMMVCSLAAPPDTNQARRVQFWRPHLRPPTSPPGLSFFTLKKLKEEWMESGKGERTFPAWESSRDWMRIWWRGCWGVRSGSLRLTSGRLVSLNPATTPLNLLLQGRRR